MKKVVCVVLLIFSITAFAQQRKVLLEEFCGAHCSQCPMGAWTLDSLLGVYPNLIGVSLHTYGSIDSMFFAEIDTIGVAYAPGAPLGAIDRIYFGTWAYVAELYTNWNARVQTRLAVPAQVNVSVSASWNSSNRNISALVSTTILNNLPAGDYRFNLYVVEDSVTGSGTGYDQQNIYNSQTGNPFFGMGNPIVGYQHRHVVRAILPYSWGWPGIIPASPLASSGYSAVFNYTLPPGYDETQVKLVGFISKYTANHLGDEVLNAAEVDLLPASSVAEDIHDKFMIYPNPSTGVFYLSPSLKNMKMEIINAIGEEVKWSKDADDKIDISTLPDGIYFVKVSDGTSFFSQKILKRR